ncbi:unnamed protein product [Urochloa humidicola]
MDAEEARLQFALLAAAPDGRRDFSTDALQQAIVGIPGVRTQDFTIRRFALESFLIIFSSQRSRDAALDAGSVRINGAQLFFRTWTRLVRADSRPLRQRVSLEIEGIPAHAWNLRTARKLLASSCWIERLEPASEDRADMSFMELTAWTDNPSLIPRRKLLVIAEHERPVVYGDPVNERIFANTRPYLREKNTLQYEVLIHLRRIADFSPRSPSPSPGPSPPSSDGDSGHDGNPDRGYGESRGDGGPRLHGFPPVYGREDGTDEQLGEAGELAGQYGRAIAESRQSRRGGVRASSSPPSGHLRRSPTASPAQTTSATVNRSEAPPRGRPAASVGGAVTPAQPASASSADEGKEPCRQKRTQEMPPPRQRGTSQALSAQRTNDYSNFPGGATDKPATAPEAIPCETVAFEVQIPSRAAGVDQAADPMIFEFQALGPASRLWRLPDAPRVGLRTYRRRPRSAAATVATEAATLPRLELIAPLHSEPARAAQPVNEAATEMGHAEPAQEDTGLLQAHMTGKRVRPRENALADATAATEKQARLQLQHELEGAKAATAAFLASISRALQVPLASLPPRALPASPPSALRRSSRLASKPLNASVRASKKGEVLVMRKLGLCDPGDVNPPDTRVLASVFHGPLDTTHFASLRDIFPAA